jgi:hypothetical protein
MKKTTVYLLAFVIIAMGVGLGLVWMQVGFLTALGVLLVALAVIACCVKYS